MSGGFFRGTSADQDTRFSNKQTKLLKSQKFPPELDNLIDTTKVKMDVIHPWIAKRATEVLGFEDEVLINFVYGLLEGKQVDGKKIQIQLTGFMEKNTGKFMKELWGLLLSAQKNASGVPQQFLDAKEEEMKKNKMETDRINQEILKRRERGGWEPEQDRKKRMDGVTESLKDVNTDLDAIVKQSSIRSTSPDPGNDVEVGRRHVSQRSNRSIQSPARSNSKSFSKSRSHSEERYSSRSPSISPRRRRRSISRERRYRSPPQRSLSPRRIPRYPSRRRSPYFRRSSMSRSRYRSRSPVRQRSPDRRRSPSRRYRSPPSSTHCRSPSLQRSPVHSPLRRRSPGRRRTPTRYRSPSPLLRKSHPHRSPRRSSQSPTRRKLDSNISPRHRIRNHSPSNRTRRSLSRDTHCHDSECDSKKSRDNYGNGRSPAQHPSESDRVKTTNSVLEVADSVSHKQPISLRSPQLDRANENEGRRKSSRSPSRQSRGRRVLPTSPRQSKGLKDTIISYMDPVERQRRKNSPIYTVEESISPDQGVSPRNVRQRKQQSPLSSPSMREGFNFDDTERRPQKDDRHSYGMKKNMKTIHNIKERSIDSDSGKDLRQRQKLERRASKSLGYQKEARDMDDSFDSKTDEKEAKRRRKEEKRLQKEEKRRKREERHRRRKEEHRAAKKAKLVDSVNLPSDGEKSGNTDDENDDDIRISSTHHRNENKEDAESQQKRLEIELREKALASLRAMKAVTR